MTIFPIVLDARLSYAAESGLLSSVLTLPCGDTTVGGALSAELVKTVRRRPTVVRMFPDAEGYARALDAAGVNAEAVHDAAEFRASAFTYEPSDWLLFLDARFALNGFDLAALMANLGETPRVARHLVIMEANAGGTRERVEFDAAGRVRRVQRYYDSVTWTVARGVACSLVPASTYIRQPPEFTTLDELRRELGVRSTPSRDLPFSGAHFDLTSEAGLLRLNERTLTPATVRVHPGAKVSETARLIGAVAVHEEAVVGDEATIIGPAVIGRGAEVAGGSVVAQAVLLAGARVAQGSHLRHQVLAPGAAIRETSDTGHWAPVDSPDTLTEVDSPKAAIYPKIKVVLEATIAILALVLLSPILALVAILVKLESRGPVLYGDPREAKDGRVFRCYKFRTMFVGADAAQRDLMKKNQMDGPQFKMDRDPRVTRIGRFLRVVSIDELPQLFNVALGQMSLVGPRPSPFRENQTCVPWRDARLSVRPGITGLWQVCRHDRSNGDFHQWIYYDMQYVRNMSFMLDLKILIATVVTLGGKGHVPLAWMIPNASKEHV